MIRLEVISKNSVGVVDIHTWQSTNKTIGIWMVRKMMKNNSKKGLIFLNRFVQFDLIYWQNWR